MTDEREGKEKNQCDGCNLRLPIENGFHVNPDKTGWERLYMWCVADKYAERRMEEN